MTGGPERPERADVLGIFGAGRFGAALARRALASGYEVSVATSGSVEYTASVVDAVAPGAAATSADRLPHEAGLLVLAVPLGRFRDLPLAQLAGHVVVDVMNYWPPADGVLPEFEHAATPTSVRVQEALPATARLVKTLNHLSHHQLEDLARPGGAPDRAAIAVSGDDHSAVLLAATLVDSLGFDPVAAGDLASGIALQPGSPIFGAVLDAAALRRSLAAIQTTAA